MDQVRRIIHLDLDAFYCAVEENENPALRGKPFAVGGSEKRGVVSSCSYAARAFGVRSAMPIRDARGLCHHLTVVQPDFSKYRPASRQVMQKLHECTDLVEQISIDEAFLDVTDLPGSVKEIGQRLQNSIRNDLNLPNSLGIATNKLVAKIANDVGKMKAAKGAPPNAMTIVYPGQEAEFLAPLPVQMLWGIGPASAEKLGHKGVTTIGEIAALPYPKLKDIFKNGAYEMQQRALGVDFRPIVTQHEPKSISQETTFNQDTRDRQKLERILKNQARNIARQLQNKGYIARTVKLKIRWSNFETFTRQLTLDAPSDQPDAFTGAILKLFHAIWSPEKEVRLIGMGVSGLARPPQQIGLWDRDWQKEARLQEILADVQSKFGSDAVGRGIPTKGNPHE